MHLLLAALLLAGSPDTLTVDLGGSRLDLVLVKAGTFQQGSPSTEQDRGDDEAQRQVRLTRDFYLGRTEVTRGQFARFAAETGYRTEAEKGTSGGFGFDGKTLVQKPEFNWRNPGFAQTDDHPVSLVTWHDATAFAAWASKKAGRTLRLPSEAEWEYGARAGSSSRFAAGDPDAAALGSGWFKPNAGDGTRPVGGKKPNRFGLLDMAGNVAEWCEDWYGPYTPGSVDDPLETRSSFGDKPRKVLRGGSWLRDPRKGRSAARDRQTPGSRNADNGFRLAADAAAGPVAAPPPATAPAAAATSPTPGPAVKQEGSTSDAIAGLLMLASLFGCCGLGIVVPLWLLLRRRNAEAARPLTIAPRGRPAGAGDVRVRVEDDGFWLIAPQLPAGSLVRYRARLRGADTADEVVVEPSPEGQFVYTSGRPADVEVVEVVGPADVQAPRAPIPLRSAPTSITRTRQTTYDDDRERDSYSRYPSAY
jgi:formylglycine-generating enzyme required for sulfatase activity